MANGYFYYYYSTISENILNLKLFLILIQNIFQKQFNLIHTHRLVNITLTRKMTDYCLKKISLRHVDPDLNILARF